MTSTLIRLLIIALALCANAGVVSAQTSNSLPPDTVVILAPLHGLHEREPAFSYDDLRGILDAADPDVLLVETRPDELSGFTETPGRPEYPAIIWPWLEQRTILVEAMEPGGEIFAAMTEAASARYTRFSTEQPAASARTDALQRSLTQALLRHWRHPADVHDALTRDLMQAAVLSERALGGPGDDEGQAAWDGYMIARAREVIARNPGRRIVILASYRNLRAFREGLAGERRLIDAEPWLRTLPFPDMEGRNRD
ncbi:MAG: hypothetical protein DCF28_04410 [Alphaproteobacteria bacterium]|nr:MAG: hypothetical protein DCF28_04410 [Alphaproteobacteria bacterium]PZO38069.1 MAG: hypothetical protein DCE92_06620 [Alphaproteobacteria bacterium]